MSVIEDLKSRLAVHLDSLHADAVRQAELACQAGELSAAAKAEARRSKVDLEEVRATVQREVRANPDKFGIDKPTEGAIASAVTVDQRVSSAERRAIAAQEQADVADAVSTAYEHRKAMLKVEVELWLANYFGDVEVKERTMSRTADSAERRTFDSGQGRRRRIEDA